MTDYQICEIDIEKSSTAKYLEQNYSCEWGFNQDTNLDPFFHLRACIVSSVKIASGKTIPIPTETLTFFYRIYGRKNGW